MAFDKDDFKKIFIKVTKNLTEEAARDMAADANKKIRDTLEKANKVATDTARKVVRKTVDLEEGIEQMIAEMKTPKEGDAEKPGKAEQFFEELRKNSKPEDFQDLLKKTKDSAPESDAAKPKRKKPKGPAA